MKIFIAASLAAAFALAFVPVSAHAGYPYDLSVVEPEMPDIGPRNCEPVGSGLEECVYDVECWEDDAQMMSICKKVIVYKPEALDP